MFRDRVFEAGCGKIYPEGALSGACSAGELSWLKRWLHKPEIRGFDPHPRYFDTSERFFRWLRQTGQSQFVQPVLGHQVVQGCD